MRSETCTKPQCSLLEITLQNAHNTVRHVVSPLQCLFRQFCTIFLVTKIKVEVSITDVEVTSTRLETCCFITTINLTWNRGTREANFLIWNKWKLKMKVMFLLFDEFYFSFSTSFFYHLHLLFRKQQNRIYVVNMTGKNSVLVQNHWWNNELRLACVYVKHDQTVMTCWRLYSAFIWLTCTYLEKMSSGVFCFWIFPRRTILVRDFCWSRFA